jgi:hypothetical protein
MAFVIALVLGEVVVVLVLKAVVGVDTVMSLMFVADF